MTTGIVVGIQNDRCAVKTPTGITVFEILGGHSTEMQDVIFGNMKNFGVTTLENKTKREKIRVSIEDMGCSPDFARSFLQGAH